MSEKVELPAGWERAIAFYKHGAPVYEPDKYVRSSDGAIVRVHHAVLGKHEWFGTAPGTEAISFANNPIQAMHYLDQSALAGDRGRVDDPERDRDNAAVNTAAEAMKAKLAQKRKEGRGGWHKRFDPSTRTGCYAETLAWSLIDHMEKGDPVDVLNLAMFLQHRDDGAEAMREVGSKFRQYAEDSATLHYLRGVASNTGMTVEQLVRDVEQRAGADEGAPDALAAKREQVRRHTHAGSDEEADTGPPTGGSGVPNIDPLLYEAALEVSYRVGLIGQKEYLDAKVEAMRARRDKEGGE